MVIKPKWQSNQNINQTKMSIKPKYQSNQNINQTKMALGLLHAIPQGRDTAGHG
jgi:hypothetical protein